MCLATCNNLLLVPQNAYFPWNRDLLVSQKTMQSHFFPTLHPIFPVIFASATVVAFVLLRNSRFNFHCYTQREATPTQKLAWKWRCDLSRLLVRKITKGIHSCKPASLICPITGGVRCCTGLATKPKKWGWGGVYCRFSLIPLTWKRQVPKFLELIFRLVWCQIEALVDTTNPVCYL